MNTFTVTVERSEDWWVAQLNEDPGLITQAKRLDQIPDMVRDALELFPELTDDPARAVVNVIVQSEETELAERAKELNNQAKQAQQEASEAMREASRILSQKGLPYRDIGTLLGVSFQRAQKLATS